MEFNIGERVRIKSYDEILEGKKNRRLGMLAGCEGKIVDKLYSEAKGCMTYRIHLDGYDRPSNFGFVEGSFELVGRDCEYTYEFEYLENLVVARLYEITDGEQVEIARGHGRIIHEGVYGIAQASSYALKRICDTLNGGSLKTYKKN